MLSRRKFLNGTLGTGMALTARPIASAIAQPRPKRLIVDAQIHMWKANTPDRPWFSPRAQLPEPMTIERVVPMIDEAGVDRVVIVPPTLEGPRVDYGQEAAKRYPGRFATMGLIQLNDPNEARRLPGWRDQAAVLGVRLNIAGEQAKWLTDGTADWFWPAAETHGLPVMFLTNGQLPLFARIAERHPRLVLIIDHMGVSSEALRQGKLKETIDQAAALAKFPNISVKVSSSTLLSSEPYPWRDVSPHIRKLYDAYGPQRCHWGTDVTNSFAKASYRQRVTHFTEELNFLSEDDKDWIMGRALVTRLRWA